MVEDLDTEDDEASRAELQYVFVFPKKGVELFAAYSSEDLKRATGDLETQTLASLGSRIKF